MWSFYNASLKITKHTNYHSGVFSIYVTNVLIPIYLLEVFKKILTRKKIVPEYMYLLEALTPPESHKGNFSLLNLFCLLHWTK